LTGPSLGRRDAELLQREYEGRRNAFRLSLAANAVLDLRGVNTYLGAIRIGAGAKVYAKAANAFSA
jgi:hypothetical protein